MDTLSSNNITTSLVRTILGESSNKVSDLCKSPNINMFSKRKPVRDARITIPLNEVGIASNYGLEVPLWNGTNQFWAYNKPRGGSNEPFRLGDFRGYFHEADIPVRINDYTGYIHMISFNSQMVITGLFAIPDADSPNIALQDVLPDYYFAVQLTNNHSETVWGTNSNPNELSLTINFSLAPFNTSNWRNATITAKFFMSSVAKTFAENDKTATKKALHYDSSNLTTQQFNSSTEAYLSSEIVGIRNSLTTGVWLWADGIYDPEDPPPAMVTGGNGGIALKCRLYNKLDREINISGSNFVFGTPSNYHGLERYLPFNAGSSNNIYDLSGNAITSINIQSKSWSDYFIAYDAVMLSAVNQSYQVPSPPADKFCTFLIKMNVLGVLQTISTSFIKRCASA